MGTGFSVYIFKYNFDFGSNEGIIYSENKIE